MIGTWLTSGLSFAFKGGGGRINNSHWIPKRTESFGLVNQKALCNHINTLQDIGLCVLSPKIWAGSTQARHCSIKGPLLMCHLLSSESRDLQLGSYHTLPHLHLSYIEFQKMLAVALISKREGYGSNISLSEGTKSKHRKENKKPPSPKTECLQMSELNLTLSWPVCWEWLGQSCGGPGPTFLGRVLAQGG